MLKMGDVVMLRSGGPTMTICGLPGEMMSGYLCEWFGESGKLERARFPGEALMYTPEPGVVA